MTTTIPKDMQIDPFYRYKRPLTKVSYVNKKGGQTIFTNAETISASIYKPPEKLRKYLQKVMGLSISKTFIIPGIHASEVIDDHVEEFIAEYVLCKACWNPETGDGVCKACGKSC